jgi:hypothetical protein
MGSSDQKSDETEDQLALVPKHFFKDTMKPGDQETVEVVQSYEGEYSIKCVYGEKDKKDEGGESENEGMGGEAEPEDAMMM